MLLLPVLLLPNYSIAQEAGDPTTGLSLAREVCAACHAVLPGESDSPNRKAPSFEQISLVPGMTAAAVSVALQTSHKTMPNVMLEPDELRNVAAYIVSLQSRR